VSVNFDQLISASADPATAENRLSQMLEDASLKRAIHALPESSIGDFVNIISFSKFLFQFISRHPEVISVLNNPLDKDPVFSLETETLDSLIRLKYFRLLQITWMDISATVDYREILFSLSELAEKITNEIFRLSTDPEHYDFIKNNMCLFALGKLGAAELNYSSDIDLIFVCSNADDVKIKVNQYQELLQNSIRSQIDMMERRGADGFLYRVDLKLRPWGKSGPLVMSIDETENYYEASSSAWERFAWLRGRTIAGSPILGKDLKERLHPFIYKRSLSSQDLDRFFEIKAEMSNARKRPGFWNVKQGEGGIRDLEFFIQMLQIINASEHENLQGTGTLTTLSGLQQAGIVSGKETNEISKSYLFLRKLENRLQMIDEQQTHELPDEINFRIIIARSMGFKGDTDDDILEKFENELILNREIAKNCFERIMPSDKFTSGHDGKLVKNALEKAWHKETAKNIYQRWIGLCKQEGWRQYPDDLDPLINVFGSSWYFTRYIFVSGARHHELFQPIQIENFNKDGFIRILMLSVEADTTEQRIERLRELKNGCMLQVLVLFLNNTMEIADTEFALTELAEATLHILIRIFALDPEHSNFPVTILSMGRMAGHEMTFGSDLDLLFLYEKDDLDVNTQIGKTIRVLLRTIAKQSPVGSLYEVDMRLRPHGNSGPLMSSYQSFIDYHLGKREVWEKQMMTRCKPILIKSEGINPLLNQLNSIIYSEYDQDYLLHEIVAMRKRVQHELGSPKGKYEIKRGFGGIMDIDFITHFFQLAHGLRFKDLQNSSTRRILQIMHDVKLVEKSTTDLLIDCYDYLKRVELCLRLFDLKSIDTFSANDKDIVALSRAMGHGDNITEFYNEYESVTNSVRVVFEKLLGKIT